MSTDEGGILQGWNGIKENVDTLLIRMDEVIYIYIYIYLKLLHRTGYISFRF